MSIKTVHLIFIICATILAGWFGTWTLDAYRQGQELSYLAMTILSWGLTLALVGYTVSFVRKVKHIAE